MPISRVRALLALANSLHAAPDPVSRKRRMLAGLCALTGAAYGTAVVTRQGSRARDRIVISRVEHRLATLACPTLLVPIRPTHHPATNGNPLNAGRVARVQITPTSVMEQYVPPEPGPEFSSSPALVSVRRLGSTGGVARLCLVRDEADHRPFTRRDRVLVDLFHKNMCWVYEADLVLLSPRADSLSPRERETLEYLLAGHSEKQIAAHMHRSRNTVHHYVKSLHKHFGISSRSELLEQCIAT